MSLEISEVEITLEFPSLISLKDLSDKSPELFKDFVEISKFRDEEGLALRLKDAEGISFNIREKKMEVSGALKEETIRDRAFEAAKKILKSLGKKEEEPRISDIGYTCKKLKSFKIAELLKESIREIESKLNLHVPCLLFLSIENRKMINIRHPSYGDYGAGNIEVYTNDLELANKLVAEIEFCVKKEEGKGI